VFPARCCAAQLIVRAGPTITYKNLTSSLADSAQCKHPRFAKLPLSRRDFPLIMLGIRQCQPWLWITSTGLLLIVPMPLMAAEPSSTEFQGLIALLSSVEAGVYEPLEITPVYLRSFGPSKMKPKYRRMFVHRDDTEIPPPEGPSPTQLPDLSFLPDKWSQVGRLSHAVRPRVGTDCGSPVVATQAFKPATVKTVGPAGGEVLTPSGAGVRVPEGAFAEESEVSVTFGSAPDPPFRVLAPVLTCSGPATPPALPLTAIVPIRVMPLPDVETLRILWKPPGEAERWLALRRDRYRLLDEGPRQSVAVTLAGWGALAVAVAAWGETGEGGGDGSTPMEVEAERDLNGRAPANGSGFWGHPGQSGGGQPEDSGHTSVQGQQEEEELPPGYRRAYLEVFGPCVWEHFDGGDLEARPVVIIAASDWDDFRRFREILVLESPDLISYGMAVTTYVLGEGLRVLFPWEINPIFAAVDNPGPGPFYVFLPNNEGPDRVDFHLVTRPGPLNGGPPILQFWLSTEQILPEMKINPPRIVTGPIGPDPHVHVVRAVLSNDIISGKVEVIESADGTPFIRKTYAACGRAWQHFTREEHAAQFMDGQLEELPHVHLPSFVYRDADGVRVGLVMELVEGRNLFDYVRLLANRGERLSPPQAAGILLQLCNALSHLHDHRILHRDVKLGNVIVREEWDPRGGLGQPQLRVKLIDLGISEQLRDGSDYIDLQREDRIDADDYRTAKEEMEPPMVITRQTEVFHLGWVMAQLLTGKIFEGDGQREEPGQRQQNRQEILEELRREYDRACRLYPDDLDVGLPGLLALVRDMLAPDPAARPTLPDVRNFLTVAQLPPHFPPAPPPPRPPPPPPQQQPPAHPGHPTWTAGNQVPQYPQAQQGFHFRQGQARGGGVTVGPAQRRYRLRQPEGPPRRSQHWGN
jgi:hypothetical protein